MAQKTAVKSVPIMCTRRTYATKEVSYTVDKFPGYVRNESFKKVSQCSTPLTQPHTLTWIPT